MARGLERHYTLAEIARDLCVSPRLLEREIGRGRLRAVRVGVQGLIRVPESAWRSYLEDCSRDAPSRKLERLARAEEKAAAAGPLKGPILPDQEAASAEIDAALKDLE